MPLLECRDVSFSFHDEHGETKALSHISFSVKNGEFLTIVGPSGCGKSTLLSLISGLMEPSDGTITICGKPCYEASATIGYMLQKDHLFEWRNVWQNMILGLEIQKKRTPEALAYVEKLICIYGLEEWKTKRPSMLSGGMRQRAALIRTLALTPELLLLDEPFSALDYLTRLSVSDDIYRIIKKERKTAILVTHDLSEAISLGDRVIILSKRPGRIRSIVPINLGDEMCPPMEARSKPAFQHYFNLIWKELTDCGENYQ